MPLALHSLCPTRASEALVQRRGAAWRISCALTVAAAFAPAVSAEIAEAPADAKAISSIQTRSPYCFQPDRERDQCFIGFDSHQVSTSVSMRSLQISIGGRRVIEDRGFFQNSLFLGLSQVGQPGYRVPCGLSGSGGDPDPQIGQRYSYQIRAEDSDGMTTQNFGSIGCPAFIPLELFRNGFESP